MRRPSALSLSLKLIMVSVAFTLVPRATASEPTFKALPPPGFEDLTSERQLVVDVYYGGVKLAQAAVTVSPGHVRFDNPASLSALISDVKSPAELTAALSGVLDTNSALACGSEAREGCGILAVGHTGVIFDEERFRVDIFLAPQMLLEADSDEAVYLADPERQPALISRFGATLAGSSRGDRSYHLQNRSLASVGALRVQADSSIASGSGIAFDNLTVQHDAGSRRFVGGIFWAPGSELLGRRKLMGAGVTTQLDTRTDKALLAGIPLSVFLQQPARVEVILDGNVILSRIYSAGNRTIDTSTLPDGSYEVLLRVQEDGQSPRTERRFFSKGSTMAPAGHPQLSAFIGFLQTQREGISIQQDKLFFQATAAYRISPTVGIDATLAGIEDKALIEAGAVLSTTYANVRLVGLATSSGDTGAAIRASSYGQSALSASFDLRAINSRDGAPLLPLSNSGRTFSEEAFLGAANGSSYVQATGIIDYRFDWASLRLSGFYRRDGQERASYNLAASMDAPLLRRSLWDVRLTADVRKSDRELSSFIGLRFLAIGGAASLSGTTGVGYRSGAVGKSTSFIGETQAGWNHGLADQGNLSADLAFGRGADGSYARGSGNLRSPMVNLRADGIHQFADGKDTTQFALTADSAIAFGKGKWAVGAWDSSDAAALTSVAGANSDQEFDILVDDLVRGTIKGNGLAPIFLAPYATYQLRLRPRSGSIRGLTDGTRSATLYPGNVVAVNWTVTPLFVFFGRIVDRDGRPVVNADVLGPHGIGRTDEEGYFQIEARDGETVAVGAGSAACKLTLSKNDSNGEFFAIGDVRCG